MGTAMDVGQLESRMNAKDYMYLQSIDVVLHLQSSDQYLTVSKAGKRVLWQEVDLSVLSTRRLQNSTVASSDLWVTDVVLLQNVQKGLRFAPWCLDYWMDPCDADQAVLTIGDTGGQVSATSTSLFESRSLQLDSDSAKVVSWDQLVKGRHSCCRMETHKAHAPAWVRKATAGLDEQVLLWNPYVTSEPVCALAGHLNAVTAVRFMQTKDQLLSFSKDEVLCLWDVSSQLCVQRVAGVFPEVPEDTRTLLFLREERQHLLLSFNSRLLLLESTEVEKRTMSYGLKNFIHHILFV